MELPEPRLARLLFADVRTAPLWLIPRMVLGATWLVAGYEKLTHSQEIWVGRNAGSALTTYVQGALQRDVEGGVPHIMAWYATFLRSVVLEHPAFFSTVLVAGELLVGALLLLGLFTGIAAFAGGLMSVAFMFAGSVGVVSANPVFFILTTWLVLAWRVAGWWGLDRWVLPTLAGPRAQS